MSERTLFSPSIEAISVGSLYRRSKNALAREFKGPVWVEGEIKSFKENRGNWYITLVEPGDFHDGSDISVDVAVWSKRRLVVQAQLDDLGIRLAAGMVVKVEGIVGISKIGRLHVELSKLDTDALMGRQEAERRRLYQTLSSEGLLEANRSLSAPLVPLRIGLVTSENSEGHNDFVGQLTRSPFAFKITLRHSAVQGPTAPNTIARAITSFDPEVIDLVCLVRGGGGELDAFDKEPVARAIANSKVPVWTGIGHTGDRAVADDVAQRSFITPTECGQGVVSAVAAFNDRITDSARRMSRLVERELEIEAHRITQAGKALRSSASDGLSRAAQQLHRAGERAHRSADRDLVLATASLDGVRKDLARSGAQVTAASAQHVARAAKDLGAAVSRQLGSLTAELASRRSHLSAFDPKQQLRRGYTITRSADGSIVRGSEDVVVGHDLQTTFAWGSTSSTVTAKNAEES